MTTLEQDISANDRNAAVGASEKREFTVESAHTYDRTSPVRWLRSHILRYPLLPVIILLGILANTSLMALPPLLIGQAFDLILAPTPNIDRLLVIALTIAGIGLTRGALQIIGSWSMVLLGQRLERDSREELVISLLGKSQTFHNRQQIGDIMARATNDVRQLNFMLNPGVNLILGAMLSLTVPLIAIAIRWPELLLVPLLFVVGFAVALRHYMAELAPVSSDLRVQFGRLNAGLAEAIGGVEVVKAYAQEGAESARFDANATTYRDSFVKQGIIQGRYLPLLLLGIAVALSLGHAVYVYQTSQGQPDALTIGDVVAFLGLVGLLRFPTFISIFSFMLIQNGMASARRILDLLNAETELDQNSGGVGKSIRGEIVFENVSFGYDGDLILKDVSFHARPGETIAIVGQTGSGKSTLTKLVNRTYDMSSGRVLVDGVDVRDWSLDSLRSQISTIEQDIFLFSRSVADNIAFSRPVVADADDGTAGISVPATREQVEQAAGEAQAHNFILALPEGYDTVIGERGVTLSGGQRQRLAIARAFLTNPRILVLDDSTSAIDSATEDQIQRAMRRIMRDRTTLLITHRLSQIRWADRILVLRQGQVVDQGTHEELMARCALYRRIFAHVGEERASGGDAEPSVSPRGDDQIEHY